MHVLQMSLWSFMFCCVSAGGRDKRGGPVLVLTQPASLELDALIEITDQEFFDMLAYFSSVPRCDLL